MNSNSRYIHLERIFPVFITFLMLFCSHDTLLFGTNENETFITIRKLIPFAIVAMTFPYVFFDRFVDTWKIFGTILLFVIPFVSCIVNNEPYDNYIYRGVIIISAAFFALVFDLKRFFEIYNRIMKYLTVWSCSVWLISLLLPDLIKMLPMISNYESRDYYFALFSNVSYYNGLSRNLGIFREPGVYVVFLIFAVIGEMLILENKRKRLNIVLYCVGLFTTFSTAGYVLLFALAAYYLFVYHDSIKESIFIIVAIILGFLVAYQFGMLDVVFEKFSDGTNTYGSWLSRLSSITRNLEIAAENPFFGVGRYALYDITLAVDGAYVADANTNTILIGSAAYGIFFGIVVLFSCLRFVYYICRKKIFSTIFISLIVLAALSNEDMGQNYVYYLLVFYGLFASFEKINNEKITDEETDGVYDENNLVESR